MSVGVDEAGQPQEHVHDHPGRDDRHPRADRLVGVGPGIGRLALLLVGALAQHLDEPAQGKRRQDVLGLAPPEAEERRPEADRELLDLHPVPLGQEEVTQLMDEDDKAQSQGDLGDVEADNSGSPTLNLPPGPGVDVPQVRRAWAEDQTYDDRGRRDRPGRCRESRSPPSGTARPPPRWRR